MLKAFVDGSAHRLVKESGCAEHYTPKNAYIAVYAPDLWSVWVEEIAFNSDLIGTTALEAEFLAIKKAVDLGFKVINSDCTTAIALAKHLYQGIDVNYVKGHEKLKTSSEEEMIMRIPHFFAKRGITGHGTVTHSFPVSREWIKTLEWNNN